jgi:hypothetical protein
LFSRKIVLVTTAVCLALGASAPAFAGKGGSHGSDPAPASCAAFAGSVHATGLPTDQVINFLISDSSGTSGWVLGYSGDGTWNVAVPAPSGATTYQFVSRTWGPDGSKFNVFASCSA